MEVLNIGFVFRIILVNSTTHSVILTYIPSILDVGVTLRTESESKLHSQHGDTPIQNHDDANFAPIDSIQVTMEAREMQHHYQEHVLTCYIHGTKCEPYQEG
jgi:hypothetical protein